MAAGEAPAGGGGTTPGTEPATAPGGGTTRARQRPPKLRDQIGTTRAALLALVRAHIDLAKAEATEIGDEVKVVAGGVGLGIAALVLVAFLVPIGLFLFLGEWLFGSLGWGVLLGTELLVLVAVAGVLGVLHAGRIGRALAIGLFVGIVVAVLFGTNAPHALYAQIADRLGTYSDPGEYALAVGAAIGAVLFGILGLLVGARNGSAGDAGKGLVGGAIIGAILGALAGGLGRLGVLPESRPMVVGLVLIGLLGALVGLIVGARSGGASGALTGFFAGFVLGGALGAFSAITFSWQVAIAIGIALFLGMGIGLPVADVATRGIDTEDLKRRFYPQTTIDTAKETIEWAKARNPLGPRS